MLFFTHFLRDNYNKNPNPFFGEDMKTNCFKLLLLALVLLVFGQTFLLAQPARQQAEDLAKYIQQNYSKREVMIPMRDGVRLFTSIYEPKDKTQKYPIMLNRTPYTVSPYGADKFKTSLGPDELFPREGYIFVYQDVRGRWMSEGEFVNVRPDIENKTDKDIDESTDTFDTVEWLLKDIVSDNGRVGIYGISYPGFYTSAGIIDSHPAIKAASPQAPVSDWFHGDDMHHNGALILAQNYAFFRNFGQPRPVPVSNGDSLKKWTGRETQDAYDYFLKTGGLKEVADSYEKSLGIRIGFWDEMMAHPTYDDWWKARNILPKLKNVKTAVMTVGGWYDNENLYGALRTYEHIERQNPGIYNVLVMGPWFHGGWIRSDGDWLGTAYFGAKTGVDYRSRFELPFFNHFLKDKGDISQIKEVNVFDTGANVWKSFENYEPAVSSDTALYLTENGGLSFETPKTRSGYNEYVSDPLKPVPYTQKITLNYPRDYMTEDQRFASTRPDVLVYQTEPLTEDVTVAGDIKNSLTISSSGTDSDFVVKLIDVFPDDYKFPENVKPPETSAFSVFQPGGYQMLLRGDIMPARFRNSFEKPEALKPNEPTKLNFTMPGVAHTFKKGHRIMIQIQSTWFPLVSRNPQKFMPNYKLASAADFQKAAQRVYFGANASAIVLPVVKK
jgi:putative CocE/NonD family hydrolase